jgi:5-(carboxyamino)imidazole ribonucleotide synthase
VHVRHILDTTIVPARIDAATALVASELARTIADRLGVIGLLAVEFFLTETGEILVNELAPRPHNSGHWSLDGCATSQFEQQVRAVCGLPLGDVAVREPIVMVNILGEAWRWRGDAVVGPPDWSAILAEPRARLHLYGKPTPRPGRKMGHFTVSGPEVASALALAAELKARL